MSPLYLVGILVILHNSCADVKHVLEGSAHPPNAISPYAVNNLVSNNNNNNFWWMNEPSPLKAAFDFYKNCADKNNCPNDNNASPPQPFRPTGEAVVNINIKKNPFLNGDYQNNGGNSNAKIDLSKNPFLSGNGQPISNTDEGFLGVQPVQPYAKKPGFATTHPLANKKPSFETQHPLEQQTIECRGGNKACVAKELCINGVINQHGEGLLQVRNGVDYCDKKTEVCCQHPGTSNTDHKVQLNLPNLNEITAGKSSIPESGIKFQGSLGLSPGFIQVIPAESNIKPEIHLSGENGQSSTVKSIRDVSSASGANAVFSSTVDYSDTKFDNDARFGSSFQGPAYLPPVGGPSPQPTPQVTYRPSPQPTPTYRPSPQPSPQPTYRPSPQPTYRPVSTQKPAPRPFEIPVIVSQGNVNEQFAVRPTTPKPSGVKGNAGNLGYLPPKTTSPAQYVPPQSTPKPFQPKPITSTSYQPSQSSPKPYQPQPSSPRPYQPQPQPLPSSPKPYLPPQLSTSKPYQPQPSTPRPYQPQPSTPRPYQPQPQPLPSSPRPYQPPQLSTSKPYQPQASTPRPYQPQPSTPRPYQPQPQPLPSSPRPYQPQPSTPRPYQPSPSTNGREYLPPRTSTPFVPQPSSPRPTPFIPPQTSPRPLPTPTQPPYRPPQTQAPYRPPQTQAPYRPPPTQPPFRPQPSTPGYQYPAPSAPKPTPKPYQPPVQRPSNTNQQFASPPSTTFYQPSTPSRVSPSTQQPYRPPVSSTTTQRPQPGGYDYPKPTPSFELPTSRPTPPTSGSNVENEYVRPPPKKVTNGYLPPEEVEGGESALSGTRISTTSKPVPRPRPIQDTDFDNTNTDEARLLPAGCAAALKCVQEIYCTADGFVSPVPVVLTKEQELSRVPTTPCQDIENGNVGKCCRDPNYKDPWPSANLVNGFDDGQYKEDPGLGKYSPDLQRNVRSDNSGGPRQDYTGVQSINYQQVSEPTCGKRHENTSPKGPGPLDANFAEIPWQAMILRDSNRSLLCGGAIIQKNAVLTAAHCVEGLETSDILIKGGEWKLGIDEEPLPFQIVKVAAIVRHPQYVHGSLLNDLAVLVLEENLRPAKNIGTICLPQPNQIPTENCIATGWGKRILQLHAKGAIMHSIGVKIMDNNQCQETLTSKFQHAVNNFSPNTLCGYSDIDQCRVDYGSALACSNGNNQYTLSGIYAWDTGCKQEGQIGGYVAPDVEWIQTTLAKPLKQLREIDREYNTRQ